MFISSSKKNRVAKINTVLIVKSKYFYTSTQITSRYSNLAYVRLDSNKYLRNRLF